jgi:tape measure domain-containing protein
MASIGFDIFARDRASATFDKVGNSTEKMGHKFSAMKVTAVTSVAVAGAALVGFGVSAVKAGVQTAASMEQANIAFTSLLGSGAKSQLFLDKLSKFAAATPFELPGLIDASRQLIGVGQSADSVIPTLTAFGDASGALGLSQDNFNHIMMATTQAMSAGTLHAGDLLQMTEAGLPVWKLMSEAFGKPVSELKKLSEQGKLLTKDVMPKLQAQMEKDYGGSMAKQSQTLTGLWSTLMDTFHQGMAKAIIPMEPMLRMLIPRAADVMGKALAALGNGASSFFNGITGHVKIMNQSARPALELFGLGLRGLAGAFKDGDVTSKGFVGKMEQVGVALRSVADFLGGAFKQVLEFIKKNGPAIFDGLKTSVSNLATVAVPLLISAWNAFKGPLQTVMQFVINTAIPAITSLTDWMAKHGTLVRAVAVGIGTVVVVMKAWSIVTRGMAIAQAALNLVMSMNPIGLVILAIAGLAAGLIYAYKHSETFRNIVDRAFKVIATSASAMWDVIRPVLHMWIDTFLLVVSTLVHGAANAFGWVPGLGGKLKAAARAIDAFRDDANRALDGIRDKVINVRVDVNSKGIPLSAVDRVLGANAAGTNNWRGGLTSINERGGEIVNLPGGTQIIPHDVSMAMAQNAGGRIDERTLARALRSVFDGLSLRIIGDDGSSRRADLMTRAG